MVHVKTNYEVKLGHFGKDADDIMALWCEGFDNVTIDIAKRKLAWSYTDNPSGEGLAFLLRDVDKGETAGVYCLGFRDWNSSGSPYKSGIMADYVVGQKHRSLGPALKLLKSIVSVADTSVDFIYGFPNEKALPVFRRAGYQELGRIGRYAKMLRSKRILKERAPAPLIPLIAPIIDGFIRINLMGRNLLVCKKIKAEWSESFDKRFDKLWDFNRTQCALTSNRSANILKWRFESDAEQNDWRIFTIVNEGDELLGYIVVKIVEKVAVVGDFYAKNSGKNFQQLFLLFSLQALNLGCDSISVEFYGLPLVVTHLDMAGFKLRDDNAIYYLPCNEQHTMSNDSQWYVTSYDRDM